MMMMMMMYTGWRIIAEQLAIVGQKSFRDFTRLCVVQTCLRVGSIHGLGWVGLSRIKSQQPHADLASVNSCFSVCIV